MNVCLRGFTIFSLPVETMISVEYKQLSYVLSLIDHTKYVLVHKHADM